MPRFKFGLIGAALTLAAIVVAAGTAGLTARTVSATHVDPTFVSGNPTCASIGLADLGEFSTGSGPDADGEYDFVTSDGFTIHVTLSNGTKTIDWSADVGIAAVIVKAGNGANVYEYDPPEFSDTGLQTPLNNGGEQANLSHLVFCYDPTVRPQIALTVEKDAAGTYVTDCSWTIEKSVVGGVDEDNHIDLPAGGGSFDVDYNIEVAKECGDSDFVVTGTITVTNTGTIDAIVTDVTDELDDGTEGVVDCGVDVLPATLAPTESIECSYTASPANADAESNTATAAGTDENGENPLSFDGSALISWVAPDPIDDCAQVTDPDALLDENVCVDTSFPVTITWTATCGDHEFTNTATVTPDDTPEDALSDSATVSSSAECLYWCSPGFWAQNQGRLAGSDYDITAYLDDPYSSIPGGAPLSKKAPKPNPTIGEVLASPSLYGGPAFNSVADYLSAEFGFLGTQETGDNCPINAFGVWIAPTPEP